MYTSANSASCATVWDEGRIGLTAAVRVVQSRAIHYPPAKRAVSALVMTLPSKADAEDFQGRFREIISDPLNLLIERVPDAGTVISGLVTLANGNRVPCAGENAYYGGFSDILILNRGVHEPLEEFAFQTVLSTLPRSPVMLELGSYWAHYSMWLLSVRPSGKTYLVEAEAPNLAIGKANYRLNGYDGTFRLQAVGRGGFVVDEFMSATGVDRLSILHSDIQGFEGEMMEGAAETLSGHRADNVFISTHSNELHERILGKLRSYGYRIELSADFDIETTSFDGFILARSPNLSALFGDETPMMRLDILQSTAAQRLECLQSLSKAVESN